MSKQTAAASTIQISQEQQTLMAAMELGETGWLLGFASAYGQKPLRRKIGSRDRRALMREIERAKAVLGLEPGVRVVSCYEAGRDGFWLHRFLKSEGVESLVVDSSSIEVNRKKRRAKTDRVDLVALLDLLSRHLAGSAKPVWSVVRVPSVEDEDRRHLHRELKLAKKDRTRVSHRMKGLLSNHGLTLDLRVDLAAQLAVMRQWDGSPLPPGLRGRLERYLGEYQYFTNRIHDLDSERRRILREEKSPLLEKVLQLYSLRALGINSSWMLTTEFFGWRDFRNGKQVGSMAGLTPTPFNSGGGEREQGIGKDGSRWVRGGAIELAWGWLRFQPQSALSQWYMRRFGSGSKRLRKIGIVALARKLLIALWRFLETGVVPDGALLKMDLRLR
ncbi:MAG TPA: IS110 family transposase [Polyangiales bacterium]|nr:IS110 family transposase [Polyangiales bacterium]